MAVFEHRTETQFMYFYNQNACHCIAEDEGQQEGDVFVAKETKDFQPTGRDCILRILKVTRYHPGINQGWCVLGLKH